MSAFPQCIVLDVPGVYERVASAQLGAPDQLPAQRHNRTAEWVPIGVASALTYRALTCYFIRRMHSVYQEIT